MPALLIAGAVLCLAVLFGEIAERFRLPKITGYILAGIALNPGIVNFVPNGAGVHADFITNIALSFITFSVGGTLLYSNIRKLGKGIAYITAFEAEAAFAAVIAGFLLIGPAVVHIPGATLAATTLPLVILLGVLASPTDPSATLAVVHEYKASGPVATTIMGVAAFDDIAGILNFSVGVSLANSLVAHRALNINSCLWNPLGSILGGIALGVMFGVIFNLLTLVWEKETDGFFIVLVFALLPLCFGAASYLKCAELLATMTMGIVVVNFNTNKDRIFRILERYTEELVFVVFFTIGGMQLKLSVMANYSWLIALFVVFRVLGKVSGAYIGGWAAKAGANVRRYTPMGLIPQGGIVIGLALLIKQNPAFSHIADIIVSVAIGAAVINELIGPVLSKMALEKAGEIPGRR